MKTKRDKNPKFHFTTDFQKEIIRFILQDKNGYKIMPIVHEDNFEELGDSILFMAIKKTYKTLKRIPGSVILKEKLIDLLNSRDFINNVPDDEKTDLVKKVDKFYKGEVRDSDEMVKLIKRFYNYTQFKTAVEGVDLLDFTSYEKFSDKIKKAIKDPIEDVNNHGTFLIANLRDRQLERKANPHVIETPIRQLNELTNAGGLARGSIVVLLDRPKKSKTAMLINIARLYLRRGKKVAYADIENSEDELSVRAEESIGLRTKREILSGEHDVRMQKILRKYKRIGAELVIKRFPAMITTCNDISKWLLSLREEHGLHIDDLIVDYPGIMGSISGKEDDFNRISDVYLELGNLALEHGLDHIYAAHHIKREAYKRIETRYLSDDIAKCIDIVRHVQLIVGLNRTPEEEENGILRMEVVEIRDGRQGRAVFRYDVERQSAVEFTPKQREAYDAQFSDIHGESMDKKKSQDNSSDI